MLKGLFIGLVLVGSLYLLIDVGAGYTPVETSNFEEENEAINAYGKQSIKVRQTSLYLQMGRFPSGCFLVLISPFLSRFWA